MSYQGIKMKTSVRLNFIRALLRALTVLAIVFAWSTAARADCATPNLNFPFTYGSIAVPADLAVGGVIPGTTRSFRVTGRCTASNLFNKAIVACPTNGSTAVPGLQGVFTTNVAGIGMRMRNSSGTPLDNSDGCQALGTLGMTDGAGNFDMTGTFELVKTGTVSTGTLSSANSYKTGVLSTGVVLNNGTSYLYIPDGTAVRAVTCTVTAATASQTVSMRTANSAALSTTGAVAGKTPFAINLTCQSGVKVNVSFSSVSGSSGVASVVGSTGTATGIGIQLLDASDTPIVLDQSHTVVNSTSGSTTVPFSAQYYRLGSGVATGTVRAAATYTMSYQ
jgi:type 1 fimbria pilin